MVFTIRFLQTVSDIRIYLLSNQLAIEEYNQYIKILHILQGWNQNKGSQVEQSIGKVFNL